MSKKEKNTTTDVAKKTIDFLSLGQKDIPGMLDRINDSITKLKGGLPVEDKTTGELPGFGKIKDINDVSNLIKAHSTVVFKARAYHESATNILPAGIKSPPFVLAGSSESSWVNDIKSRVIIVAHKSKLNKLNKMKTTLEDHLSKKMKLAKDLKSLNDMLMDDTI